MDVSITVSGSISDISKLQDLVRQLEAQIEAGAKEAVDASAEIIHNSIIDSIRAENAVATGNLISSVSVMNQFASTNMYSVQIGSSSPYASFVEEGRSAGSRMPPVDSIYAWMIAKGLEPSYSAAFAVAKSIAEKGIAPKRVFEQGLENAQSQIQEISEAAMQRNLDKGNLK